MRHAPRVAAGAAVVIVAGIVLLTADYVRARRAEARDAAAIAALQQRAQADRTAAVTLAAEQDRVTRVRQARKRRDDAAAIVLIAAAAVFIASVKWKISGGPRRPVALPLGAIRIEVAEIGPGSRAGAPEGAPYERGTGAPEGAPYEHRTGTPEGAPYVPVDLAFVEALVATEGRGKEAAIPILQAIQAHYRYLPDEALQRVCELTEVTPAQIAGTSSFYARFRRSPVGDHVIRVCHGTACHVSGARQITEELRRHLRIPDQADTDAARRFTIDEVACLGCCSLAPVLMVDEHTAGRLTPATAVAALAVVRETEPA